VAEIERAGHTIEPIDCTQGSGLAEMVVDLPPWGRGEPHVRVLDRPYYSTKRGTRALKGREFCTFGQIPVINLEN